jgi:hypothetical protein
MPLHVGKPSRTSMPKPPGPNCHPPHPSQESNPQLTLQSWFGDDQPVTLVTESVRIAPSTLVSTNDNDEELYLVAIGPAKYGTLSFNTTRYSPSYYPGTTK